MKNAQSTLIKTLCLFLCLTVFIIPCTSCSTKQGNSAGLSYTYSSGVQHGIPYYEKETEPIAFIGHRGYSSRYPENTISAFNGAAEANFDGIEVDVWESENGDVMIFHDTTTDRMCGVSENIWNVNEENRDAFPIIGGNGNNSANKTIIPTLDETLKFAKENNLTVYLHIKPGRDNDQALRPETTREIIETIKNNGMEKQAIVFSKRLHVAEEFCNQGIRVGIISKNTRASVNKKNVDWLYAHNGDTYIVSKMDCIQKDSFGEDFVKYCHDRNIKVGVYIAKTIQDIDYLISIGADFAGSNYDLRSPLETVNLLENVKPEIKKTQNTDSGVQIEWSSILGNLCGYRIYRQKEERSYELIAEIPVGSQVNILTDHAVDHGRLYSYKVIGFSIEQDGAQTMESDISSVIRLEQPTISSITTENNTITIKWSRSTGCDGYTVMRKTNSDGWKEIDTIQGVKNTTFNDASVKKGNVYQYKVYSRKGTFKSCSSDAQSIMMQLQ